MKESTRPTTGAGIADIIAQVAPVLLVAVASSPAALAALKTIKAAMAEPAAEPARTTGLTKREIAESLGVSASTIDRFDREGAPHFYCGDSKRYDADPYRAWVSGRGKKAAVAT